MHEPPQHRKSLHDDDREESKDTEKGLDSRVKNAVQDLHLPSLLLMANSPIFAAMLTSPMTEAKYLSFSAPNNSPSPRPPTTCATLFKRPTDTWWILPDRGARGPGPEDDDRCGRWPRLACSHSHGRVSRLVHGKVWLVERFKKLEDAMMTTEWMRLSASALGIVLASDHVQVASENTVLRAIDCEVVRATRAQRSCVHY